MAILYGDGKAGQHAKRTASRYFTRIMYWIGGVGMIGGFVLGILTAVYLARWGLLRLATEYAWAWALIEVVLLIAFRWGLLRLDVYTDRLARERIGWLRGGQGEGLVAWYLNYLPDTWHVFHNIESPTVGDWDHVLIGPAGIFCISTKSQRGTYSVRLDGTYLLNGRETDHIHKSQKLALKLKDELERVAGPVPWIQPVLIAPFTYIDFPTFQHKAWVLHEENLNEVFLDAPEKLKPAEVERYAVAVKQVAEG